MLNRGARINQDHPLGLLQDKLQGYQWASMSPTELTKKINVLLVTLAFGTSALHSSPLHTQSKVFAVRLQHVMWAKKEALKVWPQHPQRLPQCGV